MSVTCWLKRYERSVDCWVFYQTGSQLLGLEYPSSLWSHSTGIPVLFFLMNSGCRNMAEFAYLPSL